MLSKKKCAYCGKEFVPNNGKQKCCCKKCNTYLWRKNNPEKVKIQEHKQDEKRKGVKRYNSNQRKKWYARKRMDKAWVNKINIQANDRRNKVQKFLRDYKLKHGCFDCGYNKHHAALQFHHVSDNKKNKCV